MPALRSPQGEVWPVLRCPQGEVGSAICAGIPAQIPKKIKKFSLSLTLYLIRIYLFSASSETSVANGFFVPNAQVRPFIETQFFCARAALVFKEFCFEHLSLKNSNLFRVLG